MTRTLLAAGLFLAAACVRADEKVPVPKGARLSLRLEKQQYFIGEDVVLEFCVENVGTEEFRIHLGGDYRGPRATRYTVEAFDEGGRAVPDPDPFPMCMGGISADRTVKPGEVSSHSLQLLRYRRVEKPGTYRLRVTHDLGWKSEDASKFPAATATVRFVMPTAAQAKKIVEDAYAVPLAPGPGNDRPPADFRALSHPVYLPLLAPRVAAGCPRALDALALMPCPEATRELVKLLSHKDVAFAAQAFAALERRLPDPQLEEKYNPQSDYQYKRRELVRRAWRDEHAPEARKAARALLAGKDVPGLGNGAYVLTCLGKQEDRAALARGLETLAGLGKDLRRETEAYRHFDSARHALVRAAIRLALKGVKPHAEPRVAGEVLYYLLAASRGKERPRGWEKVWGAALRHELPLVRQLALDTLPDGPPAEVRRLAAKSFGDASDDVRAAACGYAGRSKDRELIPDVLRVLRDTRDDRLLDDAGRAALALGARLEFVRAMVARLDDEARAARCLSRLVDEVLTNTNGYGWNEKLDAADRARAKTAWNDFLKQHGVRVAAGKKFPVDSPELIVADLFPKFTFEALRTRP